MVRLRECIRRGAEPERLPVCLGLPGMLRGQNDEALRLAVLTEFRFNREITRFAKFDRRSCFYPEVPKTYQVPK